MNLAIIHLVLLLKFGDDFFKDKIIKSEADGKYYLNTKAEGFGAGDKIEIEYCEVEQGN